MKTLQLPKYKTTHAHAPESTVDVVVFLFYILNFRFYFGWTNLPEAAAPCQRPLLPTRVLVL